MKTITLFLSLILMGFYAASQEYKCKYVKDEIDEFTKERKVLTESYRLFKTTKLTDIGVPTTGFGFGGATGMALDALDVLSGIGTSGGELVCQGVNINGKSYLRFLLFINNTRSYDAKSFYLLLQNDSIIKLESNIDWDLPSFNMYECTEEQWVLLKNIPVKKIRMIYDHGCSKDVEIKEKNSKSISNAIYCIDALNIPKAKK